MGYESRRGRKSEVHMTEEEREVGLALKDYKIDSDQANMFVTTAQLYRTYLRYISLQRHRDFDTNTLSRRQFGAALRRAFPFDDEGPEPYRVRRTFDGIRQWGYLGFVGPLSAPTYDFSGRPATRNPRPGTEDAW